MRLPSVDGTFYCCFISLSIFTFTASANSIVPSGIEQWLKRTLTATLCWQQKFRLPQFYRAHQVPSVGKWGSAKLLREISQNGPSVYIATISTMMSSGVRLAVRVLQFLVHIHLLILFPLEIQGLLNTQSWGKCESLYSRLRSQSWFSGAAWRSLSHPLKRFENHTVEIRELPLPNVLEVYHVLIHLLISTRFCCCQRPRNQD